MGDTQVNELIAVQGAPELVGLRFRRVRDEADGQHADFVTMADIENAIVKTEKLGRAPQTGEGLKRWIGVAESDEARTLLIAEVDALAVGFGCCGTWREATGAQRFYHFFNLLPEWRGKGIEEAVLRWQEAQCHVIARPSGDDEPPTEQTYKVYVHDAEKHRIALLETAGYTPMAYFAQMVRPDLENIPDVAMPEGLELRLYQPEHLRAVYETFREAFLDHINGLPISDEDYRWFQEEDEYQDRHLWQVAWDIERNEIAGCILNYILKDENETFQRKRGYVEYVSVRRPWRRRGLARAMVAASLRAHKAVGMTEAGLSSHTDNPNKALNLYESVGFRLTHYVIAYGKPLMADG
jgi:mycothiol synthase